MESNGVFPLNEDAICIYADLDRLIETAGLSKAEWVTVQWLMRGYALSDIAEKYGKTRQTFEVFLKRAVDKIVKKNNSDWLVCKTHTLI